MVTKESDGFGGEKIIIINDININHFKKHPSGRGKVVKQNGRLISRPEYNKVKVLPIP